MEDGKIFSAHSELIQLKVENFMSKRRNLKKEKQERNRAYARKFKKRKLRSDGRPDGGNVTGTLNNGGAADQIIYFYLPVVLLKSIFQLDYECKYCYTDLQQITYIREMSICA